MNVVFLSPAFPPQFFSFCVALRERGVNVLGLGDTPAHELRQELKEALGEYYHLPDLGWYADGHRALAYFIWRHGRIDRIDSHTEHWLGLEAQLREDFNVPGPRPAELQARRSKSGMAELFQKCGVPHVEGELFRSAAQTQAYAQRVGFPLVFKPDLGVGAARTFKVSDDKELAEALAHPLAGYIVQPFQRGDITSYDGLVDREGRVVFETSHVYSAGIMEVVNEQRDVSYWNRREIPPELAKLGRQVVEGFGVRERFFHVEFFELPKGGYRALEINLRPPGGFTTDMMNYSADIDVYRLWARVLSGDSVEGFAYERKYHVAHVARRHGRSYLVPHDELARELGERLLWHRPMPHAFAGAMGDEVYMIRDPDFARLQKAIGRIQARRVSTSETR
ncbi:MAG: ATP-grasp domain-containing protein [Myxococcota bacterium]